jgi:hypothetical protein
MTDYKPFSSDRPAREPLRSVAVIVDVASDARALDPLLLQPCGSKSLLDRAFDCVDWVAEADQRILRTDSPEVKAIAARRATKGWSVVTGSAPAASWTSCSHLVVLDGHHPFLRPSTIDEAIRLIKLRFDIASIASCVRSTPGWWFEETSAGVEDATGHALPTSPPTMLREAHAFHVVPAWRHHRTAHRYAGRRHDPYPFEIASAEAFRVQSQFELDLAASWYASRAVTRAA